MTVLVVQPAASDPPARLADWLTEAALSSTLVRPWVGDPVPRDPGAHEAVVVLGGPMAAHDGGKEPAPREPWLADVEELLRAAVAAGTPTLGICLGAQLLATATGGVVRPAAGGPEYGVRLVGRRDAADHDPLFAAVPLSPDVVQWHVDEVATLPPGAVLLAASTRVPHQAFRVGERAWGLQFHIETTPDVLAGWAATDSAELAAAGLDPARLLADAAARQDDVAAVWRPFVERFAAIARAGAESPSR